MQINGYLYDTHVHTSEGSACGQNTGAEMARAYQKAGYAGIVVTCLLYTSPSPRD